MRFTPLVPLVIFLLPTAPACIGEDCSDRPPPLASGTYEAIDAATHELPAAWFPWFDTEGAAQPSPDGYQAETETAATARQLEVDRDTGIITVRYQRGGHSFVETWAIASSSLDTPAGP